jgi:hypothetical protein
MIDPTLTTLVARLPLGLREKLEAEVGKRWVALVLAVAALVSLIPIASVIGVLVTLAALAGVVALLLLCRFSEYVTAFVVVFGAVVLPWLALVTFNFVLRWLLRWLDPGLTLSLAIAIVVFALAACAYLKVWKERWPPAVIVAIVLAVANVVGVPLLVASKDKESPVSTPQPLISQLDLAIVVPAQQSEELTRVDGARNQQDWDVRWSVGRASDARVDWLLLDGTDPDSALAAARGGGTPLDAQPTWRADADHGLLLDVDGTPPVIAQPEMLPSVPARDGEIARWMKLAAQAAPGVPILVLLQTTDDSRVAAWTKAVGDRGSVASIQELGSRSLTDAAQALAVQDPGASQELTLATRFRPILLFDGREPLHSPLNVDDFFASGRVRLCHDDALLDQGKACPLVYRASGLVNGPTHLDIRRAQRGDKPVGTAIYVHPTTLERGAQKVLFLDYWWYLDGNPAKIGGGATCGVGLAMPGKTCFDHPSDWEGMTVVVDVSDGDDAHLLAVQFAQHKEVVRYDWNALRAWWKAGRANPQSRLSPKVRANLDAIPDAADRPIAFVGRGTHAAYAEPCRGGCHQTLGTDTTENPYDGTISWPGNDGATCVSVTCVRLLPTRHAGHDAALWNAYTGVWGSRKCILHGSYCTAELSPAAPSTQPRYKQPTRITGFVDAARRPHRCGKGQDVCPPLASDEG